MKIEVRLQRQQVQSRTRLYLKTYLDGIYMGRTNVTSSSHTPLLQDTPLAQLTFESICAILKFDYPDVVRLMQGAGKEDDADGPFEEITAEALLHSENGEPHDQT